MKKVKRLFILILMAVSLSACIQRNKIPTSQNTGNYNLTPRSVEQLDDLIAGLSLNDFLSDAKQAKLAHRDIGIGLSNVIRVDYDTVFYQITLTNSAGTSLVLDSTAKLFYQWWPMNTNYFNLMDINHSSVTLSGDKIIHTTLDNVAVYDADTFKKLKTKFDFSFISADEYILLDTIATETGYVTAYYSNAEQGFAFFDIDGKLMKTVPFIQHKYGVSFGVENNQEKKDKYMFNLDYELISVRDMVFTDDNERYILVLTGGEYGSVLYDLNRDIAYDLYGVNNIAGEKPRLELYYSHIGAGYKGKGRGDCVVAVSNKKLPVCETMVYEDEHIYMFSYKDINIEYDYQQNNFILNVVPVAMETVLDFDTDTARINFKLTDSHLKKKVAQPGDGRYTIYLVTEGFGSSAMAVKDNQTGGIKYIGNRGILYQTSYGQAGFLKNNDVFLLEDNNYSVWFAESDSSQPQFSLNKYMALGDYVTTEIQLRQLSAVLRDSENQRYIIAYYDIPDGIYQSDWYLDKEEFLLKSVYRIAVMDYNGNILADFETQQNVYRTEHPVYLFVQAEKLHIDVRSQTDNTSVASGWLDMNTGEYKRD